MIAQLVWIASIFFFSTTYGQTCYEENCSVKQVGWVLSWTGTQCPFCPAGSSCVIASSLSPIVQPVFANSCSLADPCEDQDFGNGFSVQYDLCSQGRKKRNTLEKLSTLPSAEEFLKSHQAEIDAVKAKYAGSKAEVVSEKVAPVCVKLSKRRNPAIYKYYKKGEECCRTFFLNGNPIFEASSDCISVEPVSGNIWGGIGPVAFCPPC